MKTMAFQKQSNGPIPAISGKNGQSKINDNRAESSVQRKLAEAIQGKKEDEDEKKLQGKFIQKAAKEEEEKIQTKSAVQRTENKTGMPDHLKAGVEQLSGLSMGDVRVHYNSSKPAQVQAYAYTQGTDIHVAPGQEKHLGHEAWHVAQQKQGRVQPTTEVAGIPVNDNPGLEKEADTMGARANGL